ncbi:hypothetical protein ACIQ7D_17730 [Streptomyces sp. NPDC096310]|uniref:hypothetical protein n=1 Tax=Streptomyces sp. NPDC096310 TaxID=3366082 RepID=UPI00381739B7
MEPYRDPDCTCGWSPAQGRIWCTNCRISGPLPGSLADPDGETRRHDPAVLREAAAQLAARVPPATAGPYTKHDRQRLIQADNLRGLAERLEHDNDIEE